MILLLFSFHFMGVDTVKMHNENYLRLKFQNAGEYKIIGKPQLPVITKFVPIPPNAIARLNIKKGRSRRIKVPLPVLPVQPSIPKIPGATTEFKKNVSLYNTDAYYPGKLGEIVDTVYIRSMAYLVVNLYPVQYNPVKESLVVYDNMSFSITKSGGDNTKMLQIINRYSNRYFPFNDISNVKATYLSAPVRYIIITPDRFLGLLDSFVQWKREKGFITDVHTLSEIGGGDTASVKGFIKSAYDTSAVPPTFVLLIGDTSDIQCWIGTETDNPPTDLYYSTLSGTDYFPDVYIGRISASDSVDISGTLNKIITYEKNLWSVPSDWQNKIYFIASADADADGHTIAESTHTYCMRLARDAGMIADSLFLYYNSGTDIDTALTDGRVWITYSGHGSDTSWAEIPYNVSDVNNLVNTDKNPLILSFACLTGNFASEESFGEAWIRNGENAGIGFIGSSVPSYWGEDDILQRRMFDEAFDSSQTFLGGMLDKGKKDLYEYYGGIGNSKRYFEQYNLLGDPSLDVYTNIPDTPNVSYANPIPVGSVPIDFYISLNGNPVNNALVSVHTVDSVYSGFTDNGAVEFTIQTTQPETARVYVTGHNLSPVDTLLFISDTASYLALDSIFISDSLGNNNGRANPQETLLVYPNITNMGKDTTFAASIKITPRDTISDTISGSTYIDTIPSGATITPAPFKVYINPEIQDSTFAHFQMDITDTSAHQWSFYPKLNIFSSNILYQDYIVLDSLGYFQPGDSIGWAVKIMKTGRELVDSIQGTINISSPYITLIDSTTLWDSLPRDSIVNNSSSPFVIKISPSTPIGTIIPASLILKWDVYTDTLNFSIFVGKKDYFVWNYAKNNNSGPVIDSILKALGYNGDYSTSFPTEPDIYKSIFVCAGVYPNNNLIPAGGSEAKEIVDYLSKGNRVYLEGGDVWAFDPYNGGFDFSPYFGVNPVDDGGSIDSVIGVSGLPTEDMRFGYGGDNYFIDNIEPDTNGAALAFTTTLSTYGIMVSFDNSTWKTVAASFEFGGLQDGTQPSTKDSLLSLIMNFFNSPSGISQVRRPEVSKFECNVFPNPFINKAKILYTLPKSGDVKIEVFDILGRNVYEKTLVRLNKGMHKFIWRGINNKGNLLSQGIYFLKVSFKDNIIKKKIILLR